MKSQQSSSTAAGIALVRAIEASRPESERICYDPLARSLVDGFSYTMSKFVVDSGIYARISRGAMEFITARERYIDDFLNARLSEGLEQVVILGAGFDTRAYRIPGIETTRIFEIDHPATQEVKLRRLQRVISPLPANVVFVPVDFNTQTLGERLFASGYDAGAKTLFIWQGVTMYLTLQGVESTLGFIAGNSGPGSTVIFDYFLNEFLRDTSRPEVRRLRRIVEATSEEFLFGIDQGQLEPFLTSRGFHDIQNATAEDLKRLYFTGPNAGRPVNTFAGIASATV